MSGFPLHLRGRQAGTVLGGVRHLYEFVVFYAAFAVFGVSCLGWSLPAAALYPLLPRRIGAPLGQYVIMAGFRGFVGLMRLTGLFRCDLAALDALRGEPGLVIAPNHPSLLDAVLVISRLPRVVCIMKPAIWDNPFLGGGARLASYIRSDKPLALVRRAAAELRAGHQLLVFPEGTRTTRPPVNAFKGGFALIARGAGAPIQTVFIETNSPFLGKGWRFFSMPRFPLVFRARLGRRFDAGENAAAVIARLEAYFRQELGEGRG